ncbi:Gfo/Idh/MocA family oxidoreductase [Hwanghaeella grinnelliae]|uniref:Gfo/Idh/MocA family oxidoreductase n=1 Tax=Hwanghaeella grinnelliae TaxID=2500179 RepID=A0A437QYL7_9PROT|nr:Gfo/Idh/MocA family oxidoreductase [Hwanghaeella grinnelliae]RVU39598.1 Gfo/Idh/MocA family oxidoreductase [Hwanghaeella grinnelliae]
MTEIRVAVVGTGVIGRTHIDTLKTVPGMVLTAVVDPSPASKDLAAGLQIRHFTTVDDLLSAKIADAVVVASPNDTHVPIGCQLLEAGLPILLEKPVANSLAESAQLAAAAAKTGMPVLVGHHRRHNPLIKAAKRALEDGAIGPLVMATVTCAVLKPDDYFDVAWRTDPEQGGPLLINAIHDIDLLRHFFGEVAAVQGSASNAVRGLPVEDTTAAILTFEKAGLATIALSDAAVGPWAWELSSGENPGRFPKHDAITHIYAGRQGGLSLPDLSHWTHGPGGNWYHALKHGTVPFTQTDTYIAQMEHFGQIVRGKAEPLVTCTDGIRNMEVVVAIKQSSKTGRAIQIADLADSNGAAR